MTLRRKQQLTYLTADLISSELVWLCFLGFRWMVYEGHVALLEDVLVPAFSFWLPLIVYPLVCLSIYYLSGYYLRPFQKPLWREFLRTLASAIIISLIFFFAIIIDDPVSDSTTYQRYMVSLAALFSLQFTLSYIPRLTITLLSRKLGIVRTQVVHSQEEALRLRAGEQDEVILDLPGDYSDRKLYELIAQLYPLSCEISMVPRVYDMLTGAARIGFIDRPSLIRITEQHMTDSEVCIKRASDIVLSFVGLILLSPLLLAIAIMVWCSSKGPAIYSQERIGLYGRPFQIYKFRTMINQAEADGIPQITADHDPRITPVGHWLRKYRLDELPQLWNILRGDMSIVGPRPERPYFIEQIMAEAPYYCLLYKVRPGLTSWGPIRVGYTDTMEKMIERLNSDIVYVENMSLLLDLKILFFTIGVILDGKGK
ncbi:MAG: exopolysaccharide biosynthesis polyprenyl glycosylphosphotransferase [Paludibacteraceae bacterium]|nr:exopolysaccharide biosynthesis polyprenyl glycosylphosphotransferase [Paludibacteraceae bacterium]